MWTLHLVLPMMSLLMGVHTEDWNETYPIERVETVYEVKLSGQQVCIDCTAGRSGIKQIKVSEIPHLVDGCITTFTIQGCALPDDSLQSVMDALGATSASRVNILDVPLIRSIHLIGVRADEILVERSELSSEAFNQQPQWTTIEVINSKIDLLNTSINGSPNLTILIMIMCNITHIPLGMFRSTPQLRLLHLRDNLITQVTNSNFEGLESLTILDLDQNRLTSIPDKFLQFMPTLQDLSISSNSITEITSTALQGANLIRLDFNFNKVPLSLAPRALSNMTRLETIILRDCGIKVLPADLIKGSTQLYFLELSYNLIEEVPPFFFADQAKLRYLKLNNNRLHQLPQLLFTPLRLIYWLQLDYNNITEIGRGTFASMDDIYSLSIKVNGLRVISPEAFPYNCKIKYLHVDYNALTTLEMTMLPNLDTLDLQGNLFTSIPQTWQRNLPVIKNINLRRNSFTQLKASDLSAVSHCELVDLSDNLLTSVLVEQNSKVPKKLLLKRTPLRCDCHIHAYATLLRDKRMESDAVCVEPTNLNGIKLTSVTMTDFICKMVSCPNSCKCLVQPETKTLEVECVKPLTTEQFTQLNVNNNYVVGKMTINYPMSSLESSNNETQLTSIL